MTPERIAELRREHYADTGVLAALDEVERLRGEVDRLGRMVEMARKRLPGGMTQDELLRELEEHYGPLEGFRAWLPKS